MALIKRGSFIIQTLNWSIKCADLISSPTILLSHHFHWIKFGVNQVWRAEFEISYKTFFFQVQKDKISTLGPSAAELLTTAFLSERKQFLQMTLQTDKATWSYTMSGYHWHMHFLNPFFFTGAMSSPSYSWRKAAIKDTQNSVATKQRPFVLEDMKDLSVTSRCSTG